MLRDQSPIRKILLREYCLIFPNLQQIDKISKNVQTLLTSKLGEGSMYGTDDMVIYRIGFERKPGKKGQPVSS